MSPTYPLPVSEFVLACRDWGLDMSRVLHDRDFGKLLQETFHRKCIKEWKVSSATSTSPIYRLKTVWGRSCYLYRFSKPFVLLVACLRLHRARLNECLASRGFVASPACTRCGAACEDAAHMLLHCPAYAALRYPFYFDCQSCFNVLPTLEMMLGNITGIRKRYRAAFVSRLSAFLSAINRIRHFSVCPSSFP